mmetsp:Transcript_61033/g.158406  ORF Transcript_61033/g.158406 Transcript_61033/m.158406 type:complete len:394 (+) Transcript_61033:105-1286(+)
MAILDCPGAASSLASEPAVISASFARNASKPCWATLVTTRLSSLRPMVFSWEVAICTPFFIVIFSRMSRRFISASWARRAANAALASPSASPRCFLPLASLAALSTAASVCFCFEYASASAMMRARSASVLDFASRWSARISAFFLETSRSASFSTFCSFSCQSACSSAMSFFVWASTCAVSFTAWFWITSAFWPAAISALSHSSRNFCFPSSLLSLRRSKDCFMCCIVVLDSNSVFSSKSFAISRGRVTFFTVKWCTFTPYLSNLVFISSMMCCVLVPRRSCTFSTVISKAICLSASSCEARNRSSNFSGPMEYTKSFALTISNTTSTSIFTVIASFVLQPLTGVSKTISCLDTSRSTLFSGLKQWHPEDHVPSSSSPSTTAPNLETIAEKP